MSVQNSYARALFEAAKDSGKTESEIDQIQQQFNDFVALVENSKDTTQALMTPVTSSKEKVAIVSALSTALKVQEVFKRFLVLLAQKERLVIVQEINRAFSQVRVEANGGVMGKVLSAEPISAADLESLSQSFGKKFGKRVWFQTAVDPTLLAGIQVTVNGVTYDGTLRSKLQRLRDRLLVNTETVH